MTLELAFSAEQSSPHLVNDAEPLFYCTGLRGMEFEDSFFWRLLQISFEQLCRFLICEDLPKPIPNKMHILFEECRIAQIVWCAYGDMMDKIRIALFCSIASLQ